MGISKGVATSEFMATVAAVLLPIATPDLSDLKFMGICLVVAAYAIARGLAKKAA